MTSQQIEAARVAMTRSLKRKGKVWIRVFPHKPVTKKPAETRMGKGKGGVDRWVAVIKPGTMLKSLGAPSPRLAKPCASPIPNFLSVAASSPVRKRKRIDIQETNKTF